MQEDGRDNIWQLAGSGSLYFCPRAEATVLNWFIWSTYVHSSQVKLAHRHSTFPVQASFATVPYPRFWVPSSWSTSSAGAIPRLLPCQLVPQSVVRAPPQLTILPSFRSSAAGTLSPGGAPHIQLWPPRWCALFRRCPDSLCSLQVPHSACAPTWCRALSLKRGSGNNSGSQLLRRCS